MFRNPFLRSGTIISDQGYRVVLKTRYSLLYEAPSLSVTLNYDAGQVDLDLLTRSLSAFDGDRLLILDLDTTNAVLANVSSALQWKGYRVQLVASS